MTFEEFKQEVNEGSYNLNEIADRAVMVSWNYEDPDENPPDVVIKALSYMSSIEEAENIFKNFLESKGIKTDE